MAKKALLLHSGVDISEVNFLKINQIKLLDSSNIKYLYLVES